MKKLASALIVLAISGCGDTPTQPPPHSPAAERLQATVDAFHSVSKSCPHTLFQQTGDFINSMGPMAEAEVTNDVAALTVFQSRYETRIAQCKLEVEKCGKGPARIGMTTVEAIRTDWCFPDKKNTTETEGHLREQWIYQNPNDPTRGYLYFDNGRLTAIQETP